MFSDFALHKHLHNALDKLEFTQPTSVQEQAIPAALDDHDLLVSAETGSGKTLAFLIPIFQRLLANPANTSRALILSPTRELARQIQQVAKQLADLTHTRVALITGGDDFKYQAAQCRRNPDIIIATPGRLLEHLSQNNCDLSDLEVLIIDEADRMLDMGFSEDVLKIADQCRTERQTMLFSATLSRQGLGTIVDKVLSDYTTIEVNQVHDQQQQIVQEAVLSDEPAHKQKLLHSLLTNETYRKAIVFTNTRDMADKLVSYVKYKRHRATVLHGEMTQDQRNTVMQDFRRGRTNVLIATDVAARGLDIDGIDLVVQFDMARNPEDYIHRIGRTGRAGETGKAICFIMPRDWDNKARIEQFIKNRLKVKVIAGLEAKFKGPKKVRASGKAAGTKKKDKPKTTGRNRPKNKVRSKDKASVGKRRKPSVNLGDGSTPPPLKKRALKPDSDEG